VLLRWDGQRDQWDLTVEAVLDRLAEPAGTRR
jgi:hypothetical protein